MRIRLSLIGRSMRPTTAGRCNALVAGGEGYVVLAILACTRRSGRYEAVLVWASGRCDDRRPVPSEGLVLKDGDLSHPHRLTGAGRRRKYVQSHSPVQSRAATAALTW